MSRNGHSYPFGMYLDLTTKAIKQDIIRRFRESGISLTPEQWAILSVLSKRENISQKELAESTFKDAPTVSRIIDLLADRQFIERVPDEVDRRKFLIILTQKGRNLLQKSEPIILEARERGWEGLGDDDYFELKRILDKVYSNLNNS